MNEQHFTYKIRQHLNRGAHDIRPDTLDRLARARQVALAHQKQPIAHSVLATAGNLFSFRFNKFHYGQALAAVIVLLCTAFSTLWINDQRAQELGDIDSAILSDELPIGAFTDKGFAAWLDNKSSSQ